MRRVLLFAFLLVILTEKSDQIDVNDIIYMIPVWQDDGPDRVFREADCLFYGTRPEHNLIQQSMFDRSNRIPLARHHIIPGSRLNDFFNLALRQNRTRSLINVMHLLAERAIDHYEANNDISREVRNRLMRVTVTIAALYYTDETDRNFVPLEALYENRDVARAIFFWMPSNIFIGPRHRSDDPGNRFEFNASHVMRDDVTFNALRDINVEMNCYILTEEEEHFNRTINLLETFLSTSRLEPYPFNVDQWIPTYQDYYENSLVQYFRINTDEPTAPVHDELRRRSVVSNEFYHRDPLCLLSIVSYELALKNANLFIAATILGRTERGRGFAKDETYESWRQYLETSSWKNEVGKVIAKNGRVMAADKHGYVFSDGSFVIGLIGWDLRFGNDSWTKNTEWDASTLAGQMFFDTNGRPVALAVSDETKSSMNMGWLYVYSQNKWKLIPSQNIPDSLSQVFPNRQTLSLVPKSPKFLVKISRRFHRD